MSTATDDGILLTPAAMAAVDRAAIAAGRPGPWLMENAGRAVTRAITARFPPQPVLVLCGPGNNGGDGFVIARRLAAAGWPVRVACLIGRERLKGDAARAAAGWDGPVEPLTEGGLAGAPLVVDAMFGAGLDRPLAGAALAVVERLEAEPGRAAVVAVDVPSGVHGGTGEILGAAPRARLTVTFCRLKPGHLLLPARTTMGELVLADIRIPDDAVRAHDEGLRANRPALWRSALRFRGPLDHKYTFGHAVVVGGPAAATGASRLAARAALRAGAGLVSVACEPSAVLFHAAQLTAVMVKPAAGAEGLARLLEDARLNAVLIGPGAGVGELTRAKAAAVLATGRAAVLDADAITSFADRRGDLLAALHSGCVLTPHEGEFRRLFPGGGDRLGRARRAAAECRAVVLLKGGDTIVAAPDGRACVMGEAPPELATAGTGDVLAGLILGLLAQGMPAYEAAAAGAWLHAAAAEGAGPGLIAEDLAERLPGVLAALATG